MEVGQDLANMAVKKVGVFTDSNLANLPPVKTALDSLTKYGVNYVLYDKVGSVNLSPSCSRVPASWQDI